MYYLMTYKKYLGSVVLVLPSSLVQSLDHLNRVVKLKFFRKKSTHTNLVSKYKSLAWVWSVHCASKCHLAFCGSWGCRRRFLFGFYTCAYQYADTEDFSLWCFVASRAVGEEKWGEAACVSTEPPMPGNKLAVFSHILCWFWPLKPWLGLLPAMNGKPCTCRPGELLSTCFQNATVPCQEVMTT